MTASLYSYINNLLQLVEPAEAFTEDALLLEEQIIHMLQLASFSANVPLFFPRDPIFYHLILIASKYRRLELFKATLRHAPSLRILPHVLTLAVIYDFLKGVEAIPNTQLPLHQVSMMHLLETYPEMPLATAKFLVKQGINLEHRDAYHRTIIWQVALLGRPDLMEYFLSIKDHGKKFIFPVNQCDIYTQSILSFLKQRYDDTHNPNIKKKILQCIAILRKFSPIDHQHTLSTATVDTPSINTRTLVSHMLNTWPKGSSK